MTKNEQKKLELEKLIRKIEGRLYGNEELTDRQRKQLENLLADTENKYYGLGEREEEESRRGAVAPGSLADDEFEKDKGWDPEGSSSAHIMEGKVKNKLSRALDNTHLDSKTRQAIKDVRYYEEEADKARRLGDHDIAETWEQRVQFALRDIDLPKDTGSKIATKRAAQEFKKMISSLCEADNEELNRESPTPAKDIMNTLDSYNDEFCEEMNHVYVLIGATHPDLPPSDSDIDGKMIKCIKVDQDELQRLKNWTYGDFGQDSLREALCRMGKIVVPTSDISRQEIEENRSHDEEVNDLHDRLSSILDD